MLKIANIVGARPNFMKIAPIHRRMQASETFAPLLVHTGQHYDKKMSQTFFVELGMPEPDMYLGVGSGSHAVQTASVMIAMEKILLDEKPNWILVVGDVNSTLAASLAAAKLHIPIAHVEAGLRSFDRAMPEEINRVLTDSISDLLFVTEQSGLENLKKEGIPDDKVRFVGNVMIDSLVEHLQKAKESQILQELEIMPKRYTLMTLHRPSNVDDKNNLENILTTLEVIEKELPIIFPIHPRTKKRIDEFGLAKKVANMKNLRLVEPLGYLPFLHLMSESKLLLTDSGGIQEETTYLRVPCLTLRKNTERPVTAEIGTNRLVGMDRKAILKGFEDAMNGYFKDSKIPPLWDGHASERILETLAKQ
ncbi:MAG: UDP-N-acetylglucosamine 2-epimerase (non-hydrolyzing) [Calditrichaeota bacterium]|nr:UDP-N-acetylglucosamine 2-epimerase (non-hydrolyzing) [Calditrichota bacterium]